MKNETGYIEYVRKDRLVLVVFNVKTHRKVSEYGYFKTLDELNLFAGEHKIEVNDE